MPDQEEVVVGAEAQPEAGATTDAAPEKGKAAEGKEAPRASWKELTAEIARLGEPTVSTEDEESEGTEGKEPKTQKTSKQGEEAPQPEKGKTAPEAPEQPEKKATFVAVDAEGTEYEPEWPEGVKMSFPADGRQVAVQSFDELVGLAQKGVRMERGLREIKEREQAFGRTEQQYRDQLTEAEALVAKVVTDREAFRKVRAVVLKYQDPDYRAGQEAKAKLAAVETADAGKAEVEAKGRIDAFWQSVGTEFERALPEYEHLSADDLDVVVQQFYRNAEALMETAREELAGRAAELGLESDDDIAAAAEAHAIKYLTEENLRKVMAGMNERYAKKIGKGGERKPPKTKAEGEREAASHNERIDTKLKQREQRTLRGGGALPAPSGAEGTEEPTSWRGRMDAMMAELHKAAEPS